MILLQKPSLVINAHDVPFPKYKMWKSVDAKKGMTAAETVTTIFSANTIALTQAGSQLLNVVINCHGDAGGLCIGGIGKPSINITNVGVFSALNGINLGTIWLLSCLAAKGSYGKQFCQALASASGSQVVASDSDQDVGVWAGKRILVSRLFNRPGLIDEFEGTVYGFTPAAGMYRCNPHSDIFTVLE